MLLSTLFFLSVFCPTNIVRAESSGNSSVLEDLKKDSSFYISNYKVVSITDFNSLNNDEIDTNDVLSVEIIQIAESTSKQLYLYTYQPLNFSLPLKAKSISLSTEFTPDGQNINPKNYDLELVSTEGLFSKYLVKNFTILEDTCPKSICIKKSINSAAFIS